MDAHSRKWEVELRRDRWFFPVMVLVWTAASFYMFFWRANPAFGTASGVIAGLYAYRIRNAWRNV